MWRSTIGNEVNVPGHLGTKEVDKQLTWSVLLQIRLICYRNFLDTPTTEELSQSKKVGRLRQSTIL